MEALFFLAGGVVCAARMEAIERIHARAEGRVEAGEVRFEGEAPRRLIDLPRLIESGPRRLKPGAHFLELHGLSGRALKVDRLLTRDRVAASEIHLLPPHVFAPGRQWFSHLLDAREFCAFLVDPARLGELP